MVMENAHTRVGLGLSDARLRYEIQNVCSA